MTYDREKFFVDKVLRLEEVIFKHKQEMDALWLHIRNLEEKLLNRQEIPLEYKVSKEPIPWAWSGPLPQDLKF